jgi:hypothetical protein
MRHLAAALPCLDEIVVHHRGPGAARGSPSQSIRSWRMS